MLVASHSASAVIIAASRSLCELCNFQRLFPALIPEIASHQHLLLSLDVLDAKLVGPPRQEFIELRLSGPAPNDSTVPYGALPKDKRGFPSPAP